MPETTESSAPRFQAPAVRQRQILDALSRLVVRHGLDNVSIAQVAAEAGLAKGSIYLHYDSRNDLVAALQSDLWGRALDEPASIVRDPSRTWTDKLDALVEHWVTFEFDQHELYHAVFHSAGVESAEPWTAARQLLRDVIIGGTDAGEFNPIDIDTTTDFLLHAYAGPCHHGRDRESLTTSLQRLFRRSVGIP